MMAVDQPFPADLLAQPPAARLSYFRALTIGHPALCAAYEELWCAIRDAAPGSLILVSGPAGVGKTTLLQRTEREIMEELLPELEADPQRFPLVRLEAVAPEAGSFNWKDYFRRLLLALEEPLVERKLVTAPATPAPALQTLAERLGYKYAATLKYRAPDLYRALRERRKIYLREKAAETKAILQAALAEDPPPTLRMIQLRLGVRSEGTLKYQHRELCRAIVERYRDFRQAATLKMRPALEAALTEEQPPSVRQIARRTHRCISTLYRRETELCQRLAARRLEYLSRRAASKKQAAYEEIRQVVARLHAAGIYPSLCRVVPALSASYFMRHEEGRAVYREAKRELGIRV